MALFVSHSSQDRPAIGILVNALRSAHQQVWLDEDLGGGEAWWRTILEEIRSCEVFIFALSNNSIASKPCQAELRYAEALHRPILPVQIGPVDSLRVTPLGATQIIDYRDPTVDTGIQLIEGVHESRAKLPPLPSPLPDEPPVPFAYLIRLGRTLADPELSPHQQAELVARLKAGLEEDVNDPAARGDIVRLLSMLRDRPDVTYRTRTDIDAMLKSIDPKLSEPTAEPVTPPVAPAGSESVAATPAGPEVAPAYSAEVGRGPRPRTRWLIAGAGGLAVLVAIVVAAAVFHPWRHPALPPGRKPGFHPAQLMQKINTIMGTSEMKTTPDNHDNKVKPVSSQVEVSPPWCLGATHPARI